MVILPVASPVSKKLYGTLTVKNASNKPVLPLISKIRADLHQMSPIVQQIALLICENPEKTSTSTIQDIANDAGVSVSSVVRFCHEVGFSNLADFRLALAQEIARSSVGQSSSLSAELSSRTQQLAAQLNSVMTTVDSFVEDDNLNAIADAIYNANRIICFGLGASMVSASFMYYRLLRLGVNVSLPPDAHTAQMITYGCSSGDVALLFSASGATTDIVAVAKYASKRNLKVVGITNLSNTELSGECSLSVVVGVPESFVSSGELCTKLGGLMIVDTLIDLLLEKGSSLRQNYENIATATFDKSSSNKPR